MTEPIAFSGEPRSNAIRAGLNHLEPLSLRTFTPSQAVLARSAGIFHWTPEGRRLYDYTSGVLVANLGHNPARWMARFARYLQWSGETFASAADGDAYVEAVPLTSYNAITEIELIATERLVQSLQAAAGGTRLESVMWAASGSEAIQKALWCCMHRRSDRNMILATRHGFHGKKGLAGAVTGSESDPERDPRVRFIGFPMDEIRDVSLVSSSLDLTPYRRELDQLWDDYGERLCCLITEPYLGGGGSYHPPAEYLQLLQSFCREHDLMFVLDEVQANFGRTGRMYAFEKYGLEPDIVVLGKGLGNGVPVSAAVGPHDLMNSMGYGAASDTWSANPLSSAAVVATLDEFEDPQRDLIAHTQSLTPVFLEGLNRLKETDLIVNVRGEGMVFGIECGPCGGLAPSEVATQLVRACYEGLPGGDGLHLLGALAGKVLRISPPLTITHEQSQQSLSLLQQITQRLAERLAVGATATSVST